MFTNLGNKLMMMAKILCWLGIVVSAIAGIILMTQRNGFLPGLLTLVIGVLVSWIGSWSMYGLGEIVKEAEQR